jgi:O-antigen ligase
VQNAFIVFLLFILSFILFPIGISPFETPKLFIAQGAIFLFALYSILFDKDFFSYPKDKILLISFCSIIVLAVTQALVYQDTEVLFGGIYRLQGLFFILIMLLWAYTSARFSVVLPVQVLYGILIAHILLGIVLGTNDAGRVYGLLGEPNSFAAYLLFLFSLIILHKKSIEKMHFFLASVLIVVGLYISGSRSAIIAFCSQILFLGLIYKNISKKIALSVSLVILLISLVTPFFNQTYYENRADIWRASLQAGLAQPIIGNGFGAIHTALSKTFTYKTTTLKARTIDSTHNIVLDWWVQAGLIGISLIVTILGRTMVLLYQQKNTVLLTALLGILGAFLFNPMSVVLHVCLWYIVGQALATKDTL